MDYQEFEGKSIDDALTNASIKLETASSNLEYEVVSEGSTGFLGMFSKPAVIKARLKSATAEKEEKPVEKQVKKEEKPVEKKVEPKPAKVEEKAETTAEKPQAEPKSKPALTEEQKNDLNNKAKSFLDKLFEAMNVETVVELKMDDDNNMDVVLSGPDMGILIGKRGQTLDSIQYLTSLYVNKESDAYIRVKLDTENYRARRKETLEHLAKNIAYKVKRTRKSVSLEPMNPYERRIIHSALQNDKYVCTKSEGEEPYRKVVIMLKRS